MVLASTYDPSLASAINAEFRELLTLELEKVDDRFFEVHDTCEEQIDELDATVYPHLKYIQRLVAQWLDRGRTGRMVCFVQIPLLI